jgi:hypothetical protein
MAYVSRLMVHGSWFMAHGSPLMAKPKPGRNGTTLAANDAAHAQWRVAVTLLSLVPDIKVGNHE